MIVNLGLAYMLNAEYEQAQARYAQAVSFCAQHRLVLDPGLVLNSVSVQMKLGHYLPALQLLKAHWHTLSKTETVWQRAQVMQVFCLVFLNRCAEAQQLYSNSESQHQALRISAALLPIRSNCDLLPSQRL
jgi:hypothetical protein